MSYDIDLSRILMILLLVVGIIIFPVLLLLVVVVVSNIRTMLSLRLLRDVTSFIRIREYIFNDLSLILMISRLGSEMP